MLKLYLRHSRSVTSFHVKIHYHLIFSHSLFTNFFVNKVCYVGKTTSHFINRINEHLQKDPNSNIFKHLQESRACNSLCKKDCFSVIDQATTEYQLKMKEAMYIKWIQPKLNKQALYPVISINIIQVSTLQNEIISY